MDPQSSNQLSGSSTNNLETAKHHEENEDANEEFQSPMHLDSRPSAEESFAERTGRLIDQMAESDRIRRQTQQIEEEEKRSVSQPGHIQLSANKESGEAERIKKVHEKAAPKEFTLEDQRTPENREDNDTQQEEEEEEEEGVFEINDYTCVTEFEKLVNEIEKFIHDHKLAGDDDEIFMRVSSDYQRNIYQQSMLERHGKSEKIVFCHEELPRQLEFQEKYYNLMYYEMMPSDSRLDVPYSLLEDQGAIYWPAMMFDMLNSNLDFPTHSKKHARWFGLTRWFFLLPQDHSQDIGRGDQVMLQSALNLALSHTKCPYPGFVPLGDPEIGVSSGHSEFYSLKTEFQSRNYDENQSVKFSNLSGLTDFFLNSIEDEDSQVSHLTFSVRYTYSLERENNPLFAIDDSLDRIDVCCLWPSFKEGVHVDNDTHSDLEFGKAQILTIRVSPNSHKLPRLTRSINQMNKIYEECSTFNTFAEIVKMDRSAYGEAINLDAITESIFLDRYLTKASQFRAHLTRLEDLAESLHLSPPFNLFSEFVYQTILHSKTPTDVAQLWHKFVEELRWCWDRRNSLQNLPLVPVNFAYSELYQNVLALHLCIYQANALQEMEEGTFQKSKSVPDDVATYRNSFARTYSKRRESFNTTDEDDDDEEGPEGDDDEFFDSHEMLQEMADEKSLWCSFALSETVCDLLEVVSKVDTKEEIESVVKSFISKFVRVYKQFEDPRDFQGFLNWLQDLSNWQPLYKELFSLITDQSLKAIFYANYSDFIEYTATELEKQAEWILHKLETIEPAELMRDIIRESIPTGLTRMYCQIGLNRHQDMYIHTKEVIMDFLDKHTEIIHIGDPKLMGTLMNEFSTLEKEVSIYNSLARKFPEHPQLIRQLKGFDDVTVAEEEVKLTTLNLLVPTDGTDRGVPQPDCKEFILRAVLNSDSKLIKAPQRLFAMIEGGQASIATASSTSMI